MNCFLPHLCLLFLLLILVCSKPLTSPPLLNDDQLQAIRTQTQITPACQQDLEKMSPSSGSQPYQSYSFTMRDSVGKTPPGIEEGNFYSWGYFEECRDIPDGWAHYAVVKVLVGLASTNTSSGLTLQHGVCSPSSCTEEDISSLYSSLYSDLLISSDLAQTQVQEVHLQHDESIGSGAAFTIFLLCLLGTLVLVGTVGDFYDFDFLKQTKTKTKTAAQEVVPLRDFGTINKERRQEGGNEDENNKKGGEREREGGEREEEEEEEGQRVGIEILKCWSLKRNVPRLLSLKQNPNKLLFLDGIRFLSLSWVVLSHVYFFGYTSYLDNLSEAYDWSENWDALIVVNGFFSVDSFFFLSGLLVTFLSLKHRLNFRNFGFNSYLAYVWHRYWRLTPTWFVLMLTFWQIVPLWGQGPVWYNIQDNTNCDKYWWANMLYINNFYPERSDMCAGWGWYLAVDFQLYLVVPVFILLWINDFKWPTIYLWILSVIGTIITTSLLYEYYDLNSYFLIPADDDRSIQYHKPYTRAGPFLVGMVVAFIWDLKKEGKWKYDHETDYFEFEWNRRTVRWAGEPILWFGHFVCVATLNACIFALYPESSGDTVWSSQESAFYESLSRLGWGLGLGWICFVCELGKGSFVNDFLSWPIWQPLSAISYCGYLVHPVLMYIWYWNIKTSSWHLDSLFFPVYFVGGMGFVVFFSAVLHLLIEVPSGLLSSVATKAFSTNTKRRGYVELPATP